MSVGGAGGLLNNPKLKYVSKLQGSVDDESEDQDDEDESDLDPDESCDFRQYNDFQDDNIVYHKLAKD